MKCKGDECMISHRFTFKGFAKRFYVVVRSQSDSGHSQISVRSWYDTVTESLSLTDTAM